MGNLNRKIMLILIILLALNSNHVLAQEEEIAIEEIIGAIIFLILFIGLPAYLAYKYRDKIIRFRRQLIEKMQPTIPSIPRKPSEVKIPETILQQYQQPQIPTTHYPSTPPPTQPPIQPTPFPTIPSIKPKPSILKPKLAELIIGKAIPIKLSRPKIKKLPKPLILENIEIRSILGIGGFAATLLAVDEYGRSIVIKMPKELFKQLMETGQLIEATVDYKQLIAFERETKILNQLNRLRNPHIIKILDIYSKYSAIIFEYCEGGSLKDIILDYGPISIKSAITIGIQVSQTLLQTYELGLLCHGDIKPTNLLFTRNAILKITDWNIARIMTPTIQTPQFTGGTLGYAAPEQLNPNLAPITEKVDVFSLAVTIHEAITGINPLEAKTLNEYIEKIKAYNPIDLPPQLASILSQAIKWNPNQRITMKQFNQRLTRIYDIY